MGAFSTICCLSYNPRTKLILAGQGDNTLHIWNSHTRIQTQSLFGHTGRVTCAQFDNHKIVSGSSDRRVKIWSMATGECALTCESHTQAVCALTYDDFRIVSGDEGGEVKVWDFAQRDVTTLRQSRTEELESMFLSEDDLNL
eukprot:Colp12_sorted_trinity150504_noHs@30826